MSNSGNIESIDVFQSWDGGKESLRADEAAAFFERVWNGDTDTTLLCELPPVVKAKLNEMAKDAVWTDLLEEVKDDFNVISYVNNVYAAKMAMLKTYGRKESDIMRYSGNEKKGAPVFDGRNYH